MSPYPYRWPLRWLTATSAPAQTTPVTSTSASASDSTSFSRLAGGLLSTLLPQDCHLCAAPSGRHWLCPGCLADLPRLTVATGAVCPQCAMPSATGEICGLCLRHPPAFDATRAALRYAFPVDRLIQGLKYGARLPIAHLLAALMRDDFPQDMARPDVVIAMPLHRVRIAERGFNQAMEIARGLASSLSCPLQVKGVLRERATPPQADLPAKRRRANVRGAFRCAIDLSGRHVAVVDDVMTTGASLDELAQTLKRAGAVRVENWVAARTWPDDASHV